MNTYIYSVFFAATHTHVGARATGVHTSVCTHTRKGRAASNPDQARSMRLRAAGRDGAPQAVSGAYPGQCGDKRDVPRADVCIERRSRFEHLRAEPHAIHADGKCSHVSARDAWVPNHARTRACTHGRTCGSVGDHARIGDTFLYVARRRI